MRIIPATAIRKIYLVILLIFLSVPVFAQSPAAKILYVGAVAINPCQDAKVLADWYSQFGIETKEYQGGYYAQLNSAAGPFFFAIHPKKADAPKKCSPSISVVFRVENFETSLSAAKSKGLLPYKTEKDPNEGQFAHFHDPDGNEVTLWGK
jgi:predicted enzyme related to lactoylglutathione lyase